MLGLQICLYHLLPCLKLATSFQRLLHLLLKGTFFFLEQCCILALSTPNFRLQKGESKQIPHGFRWSTNGMKGRERCWSLPLLSAPIVNFVNFLPSEADAPIGSRMTTAAVEQMRAFSINTRFSCGSSTGPVSLVSLGASRSPSAARGSFKAGRGRPRRAAAAWGGGPDRGFESRRSRPGHGRGPGARGGRAVPGAARAPAERGGARPGAGLSQRAGASRGAAEAARPGRGGCACPGAPRRAGGALREGRRVPEAARGRSEPSRSPWGRAGGSPHTLRGRAGPLRHPGGREARRGRHRLVCANSYMVTLLFT